jgi:hypothetical protein
MVHQEEILRALGEDVGEDVQEIILRLTKSAGAQSSRRTALEAALARKDEQLRVAHEEANATQAEVSKARAAFDRERERRLRIQKKLADARSALKAQIEQTDALAKRSRDLRDQRDDLQQREVLSGKLVRAMMASLRSETPREQRETFEELKRVNAQCWAFDEAYARKWSS